MKKSILIIALIYASFPVKAQTILVKEKGVSLSYGSSFVNTITCGDKKFKQYKITAYLENKSGHDIEIGHSNISYCNYTREVNASCKDQGDCSAEYFGYSRWANDSMDTKVYYVLVPDGDELPEPEWYLSPFKIVDEKQ